MRQIFVFGVFFLASVVSLHVEAAPIGCHRWGGKSGYICDISFMRLVAHPREYNNRLIRIVGVFGDGDPVLLFANTFSYQHSIADNAVYVELPDNRRLLKGMLDLDGRPVPAIGTFKYKPMDMSRFATGYTVGVLTDVQSVAPGDGPWERPLACSAVLNKLDVSKKASSGRKNFGHCPSVE